MLTTVTSGSAAATEAGSSFERYLDEKNAYGFFPVGEKNFGFGAKFSINFTMTKDGINPLTNEHMKFNFRGDDDVWVFIDDELMLDIGGAHGAVGGYIDFADGIAHVNHVKKPTALSFSDWGRITVAGVSNVIKSQCTVAIGKNDYVYSDSTHTDTNIRSKLEKKGLYDDPTETHTLTVFYIERGRNESNCLITFNFQQADTLTVRNKVVSDVNPAFKSATDAVITSEGFEYKLMNNGVRTEEDGPDDDETDINDKLLFDSPNVGESTYTIRYLVPNTTNYYTTTEANNGTVSWSVAATDTGIKGKQKALSMTPTRSGYVLKGWFYRGTDTPLPDIPGDDDTTTTALQSIRISSSNPATTIDLYSMWEVKPADLSSVPGPTVMIIRYTGSSLDEGGIYSGAREYKSSSDTSKTNLPFTLVLKEGSTNYFFVNYTTLVNGNNYGTYWNVAWSNSSNTNQSGTEFLNNSSSRLTGDEQSGSNLNLKSKWLYMLEVHKSGANTSSKFDFDTGSSAWVNGGSSGSQFSNLPDDIKKWYKNYRYLYQDLADYHDNFDTLNAGQTTTQKNATINSFNSIVAEYKRATYNDYNLSALAGLRTRVAELHGNSGNTVSPITTAALPPEFNMTDGAALPAQTEEQTQPELSIQLEEESGPQLKIGSQMLVASGSGGAYHWAGSSDGTYQNVASTNFRYKWTEGTHSVVRRTTGDGKFYITDAHMAKFVVQFKRHSNLRLWQTGNSYRFTAPDYSMETVTGDSTKATRTAVDNNDDDKRNLLSKRYATTWMMYDNSSKDSDGKIIMETTGKTSDEAGYTAWTASGNDAPSTGAGFYSFLMDYLNSVAPDNDFVDVYVEYTNTVLTGNVSHTKTVTPAEAAAHPNQSYPFLVSFYDVFGGDSDVNPYEGQYKLYDDQGDQIAADGSPSSSALTTDDGVITLKAGWTFVIEKVPVMTGYSITEQLNAGSGTVAESVKASDITVDKYTVTGMVNSNTDFHEAGDTAVRFKPNRAGILALENVGTAAQYRLNDSASLTSIPENGKIAVGQDDAVSVVMAEGTNYKVSFSPTDDSGGIRWEVSETVYNSDVESLRVNDTLISGEVRANVKGTEWSGSHTTTNLTNGTEYKDYAAYTVSNAAFSTSIENDVEKATIIIRKQIDKRYYYTEDYTANGTPTQNNKDNSDNPADLYGSNLTVGGQSPNIAGNDANGYQEATDAVQTFIYRIEEYAPAGTGDTDEDEDGYNDEANLVFYETITFDSSDALDTFKYRIIKAEPGCKYIITELEDWSWKYKPSNDASTAVTPEAAGNGVSGDKLTVTVRKFGNVTVPPVDVNGKITTGDSITYHDTAMATYYNIKDVTDKDIEGDTCMSENIAVKAS
ncbi:MAG: fibro-slime domain-containing protein [Clostridia bacterium]|nr:fibro-slime domain-containing protein [Clostridia bacterium]